MRKNIFILLLSFFALSSFVLSNYGGHNQPAILFESVAHDFGELKEDEIKGYVFKFKNTGNAPLVINNVEKPCGCTHPEWSKVPIMPGQSGEINVLFSAKGQPKGFFRKTLNVYSNIEQERTPILMIKGTIVKGKVGKK